jgi:hypothetical protein
MNDLKGRGSDLPEPIPYQPPITYVPPPVGSAPAPRSRSRFPAWGAAAAAVALVVGGAGGYVVAHDNGSTGFSETGGFSDGGGFAPSGDRPAPPRTHDDDGGSSTGEGAGRDT